MTYDQFVAMIKRHEGYRGYVYRDSVGVLTAGWGHAFHEGSEIPTDVATRLLWHDLYSVTQDYERLNLQLDPGDTVREFVIKDMLFNLGVGKLFGFSKMIAAIKRKDYLAAATEMLDSKWARQVGARAVELAEMMRAGIYEGD